MMMASLCATATMALFLAVALREPPNLRTCQRYRLCRYPGVRDAAHAHSTRTCCRCWFPFRGLPEWRLPADSWLPGHTPIQDAKWPAEGNVSPMSAPASEMIAAAANGPMPAMVVNSSRWARNGCIMSWIWVSRLAIISSRWSRWSRCSRHISAWWSSKRPHPAFGQLGEQQWAALAIDECFHHRPHRAGGDRPGHRIDLDPGVLKDVAEALQLAGARLGELGAIPDHIAGSFDLRGRDERTPQQSAFQQMHQPFGIGQVRFAARHVTHMAGVADQDLLEPAVLNQRVIHRHRIDPGRFHRHMGDLLLGQPPCSMLEHPVERLKRLFDRLPMLGTVTGKPHRHRDDVFSDIDCRATLIQNPHGVAFIPGVPS